MSETKNPPFCGSIDLPGPSPFDIGAASNPHASGDPWTPYENGNRIELAGDGTDFSVEVENSLRDLANVIPPSDSFVGIPHTGPWFDGKAVRYLLDGAEVTEAEFLAAPGILSATQKDLNRAAEIVLECLRPLVGETPTEKRVIERANNIIAALMGEYELTRHIDEPPGFDPSPEKQRFIDSRAGESK